MPEVESPNEPRRHGDFRTAWLNFIATLREVFTLAPAQPDLDHFIPSRNAALDLASSKEFVDDLTNGWAAVHDGTRPGGARPEIAHPFLFELYAFPPAVDSVKRQYDTPGIRKRLLSVGETIVDSAGDFCEAFPIARATLRAVKEAISIFKGD